MATQKFLDLIGLGQLWQKITALVTTGLDTKVDKVEGSSLMLDADKNKLDAIADGAQVNVLEAITLDGTALTVTDKTVEINLAGTYATVTSFDEFKTSLAAAYVYTGTVADKEALDALPTEGLKSGTVYNVESDGMNYAWNGTEWDALGGTTDLSAYLTAADAAATYLSKTDADTTYMKIADLVAITSTEIDEICA